MALRRAVAASLSAEDMLAAAFGEPEFYSVDPAYYPEGFALHSEAGAEIYRSAGDLGAGQEDGRGRRLQGREDPHHGQPAIRLSLQAATVGAEFMRQAGLNAELAVMDWATLLQTRNDASAWDIFITHGPILPEPTLYSFMSPAAPGWWSGPGRDAVVAAFNGEPNPQRRAALWGPVQQRIYEEVPIIRAGNFGALAVRSRRLQGVTPAVWPFFWNSWIEG